MLDNWFIAKKPATQEGEEALDYNGPDYHGFITGIAKEGDVAFVRRMAELAREITSGAGVKDIESAQNSAEQKTRLNQALHRIITEAIEASGNPELALCFMMGLLGQALIKETEVDDAIKKALKIVEQLEEDAKKRGDLG